MKVRVKFQKRGNLRFVGHLDLMRFFQKANRRAGIPVAYSEGFSPHQIMSFAAPLGMGLESDGEYFDMRFRENEDGSVPGGMDSVKTMEALNREMAEGLKILSVLKLPDNAGNCMSAVHAADYTITMIPGTGNPSAIPQGALKSALDTLLLKETILIQKEGKKGIREVDIKPMVFSAEVSGEDTLNLRVAQGSEANLKPELLIGALSGTEAGAFLEDCKYRILRTELYDHEMRPLSAEGSAF